MQVHDRCENLCVVLVRFNVTLIDCAAAYVADMRLATSGWVTTWVGVATSGSTCTKAVLFERRVGRMPSNLVVSGVTTAGVTSSHQ
jgi:hypothetical protein